MGNIHDALKKAEREREERRKSAKAEGKAPDAPSEERPTEGFRFAELEDLDEERSTTRHPILAEAIAPTVDADHGSAGGSPIPKKGIAKGLAKAIQNEVSETRLRCDEGLIAVHDPADARVEQFRIIKSNMKVLKPEPKTFLLCSSVEGEGSNVTAGNLAVIFAEDFGTRVLIVDANLRRGEAKDLFGLPHDLPGFAEVASGRAKPMDVVADTGLQGVSFVPAGRRPPNPGALVSNPHLPELIGAWSSHFDRVIIDAPPALGASDATVLGRMVDGVIMVVRLGLTPRKLTEKSVDTLAVAGVRVLGCILTDSRRRETAGSDE